MVGPNMMDEFDCGNFFDHIDDILDFPCEDIEAGLDLPSGKCDAFPSIWSAHSDSLPTAADSVFDNNSNSDLSAELSVPYEDMMQLEWLSKFVDDSFNSESLTMNNENFSTTKDSAQFQTSSPVSVLESSSSCSGEKPAPCSPDSIFPRSHGKARSKRPRPATFQPRPTMQILSPTSSGTETPNNQFVSSKASSDSENYAESRPMVIRILKQADEENKKKKKIKLTISSGLGSGSVSGSAGTDANPNPSPNPTPQSVRKCLHCEITKTPQWRAGPLGPKTLCNACGVRYKSGRLFPEYRPAASPTFVPALHSNSHKKVIEMRNKLGEKAVAPSQAATAASVLIPNTAPVRLDYI